MNTPLKPIALSILGGVILALGGGLAWWLGSLLFGAAPTDHALTLVPMLIVGVLAAGAGAAVALFLHRPAPPSLPTSAVHPEPKLSQRKRPKSPLARVEFAAWLSPARRWRRLSRGLSRLLRCESKQPLDKPIFAMVHPEDVPALDHAFALAQQTREVQSVLCRLQLGPTEATTEQRSAPDADTQELPILDPTSLVYVRLAVWAKVNRAGKLVRFDCRFTDLSPILIPKERELDTARRELGLAKARWLEVSQDLDRLKLSYRELYQNAPVMYFSLDRLGHFVTLNDTLVETLGYQRRELQGEPYTRVLAPTSQTDAAKLARSTPLSEGERETQWRKKDGAVIDVWLHSVAVFDEDGRFVRCRSAALDLTEKNRLSHELRTRGDELERMNDQLRRINSELEAFTHVVSHDLKEPLRTLQAYSHILAEEHGSQLGPDGFQYINHLIRASRRLGQLIDELLNLSHAGRSTRAPHAFNLLECVATVRQDLVDLIQRKQAIILTEGSLPQVVGDPVRITQLLANLVGNGLKYNREPAPRVVIGARPCDDDPERVTIFVRDNGIGIDPAFHEQIFGIFRRLHQPGEFEGTGAGLAICKKIVEGHGGRIWVESSPGQGATFYFTLPRAPVTAEASRNGKPKHDDPPSSATRRRTLVASVAGANGNGRSPRIVVVDDQSDVGLIIQKLGQRDGLTVTWYPTAEDAWEQLQHEKADLLLLDVNLPGMNGIELCRRLRGLAHLQSTPIAMFTPDQEEDKLQSLRSAGADYFLSKDLLCKPADWQQRMHELLEQIEHAETPLAR